MSLKLLAPNYQSRLDATKRNLDKGKLILNIGCGDGYYNNFLIKNFETVIAIDVNQIDLIIANALNKKEGIHYFLADATNLPFKDNAFDEVICIDVIEHVKNHEQTIKEIYRVLKKGGKLIITVPHSNYPFSYDPINFILERLFKKHLPIGLWFFGHLRLYSMNELENLLKKYNFRVLNKEYLLHFFSGIFENYYLINLLQPFTKSDRSNRQILLKQPSKFRRIEENYQPPKFLTKIRDLIIKIDEKLFKYSKYSLGILIKAQK